MLQRLQHGLQWDDNAEAGFGHLPELALKLAFFADLQIGEDCSDCKVHAIWLAGNVHHNDLSNHRRRTRQNQIQRKTDW